MKLLYNYNIETVVKIYHTNSKIGNIIKYYNSILYGLGNYDDIWKQSQVKPKYQLEFYNSLLGSLALST